MWVFEAARQKPPLHQIKEGKLILTIRRKIDGHETDCITLEGGGKHFVEYDLIPPGRVGRSTVPQIASIVIRGENTRKLTQLLSPSEAKHDHPEVLAEFEKTVSEMMHNCPKRHPNGKDKEINQFVEQHLRQFQVVTPKKPKPLLRPVSSISSSERIHLP